MNNASLADISAFEFLGRWADNKFGHHIQFPLGRLRAEQPENLELIAKIDECLEIGLVNNDRELSLTPKGAQAIEAL